ncbi:UbiA-like protein EboC [Zobellia galactanivorans]|uniref:UbiA prenyltransferase family protein n=1 Tax=Zobellia galactanivorans (strain DSM 12802 / CCUG 47099 / CIP 106680 / NCIMB 13871 / Dsij) TaxID=63186 RepID=G0L0Z8_ZOBGA|nr:UbiA-like protein EboC [Zobellia galactanivorans]MDO6810257.1 UbiA-like protein EboC [Zobellia galactanivorans]CAZ94565.1 UbiA prenyltransferase family protein [Zobellia galactanivorans]
MNRTFLGYARLARPANLPTAAADILAGVAIGGVFVGGVQSDFIGSSVFLNVVYLVFSSVFLYAGGVILNDVFDFKLDKVERPERPIPSGVVPLRSAAIYGGLTLTIGVGLAFLVSQLSGIVALALALAILLYDAVAKRYDFFGPLSMGLCRGVNLLLGMSVLGNFDYWFMALIPIVYIFAITLISRGEVHGKNKNHIVLAGVLYATVVLAVASIAFLYTDARIFPLLFLVLFAFTVFRPLIKAYTVNSPENIKKAVMAGVIALILLDSSIAVAFSDWWYGLCILALLPVSMGLSKLFAVT